GAVRDAVRQANGGEPPAADPAQLVCQAQDEVGSLVELAAGQRRLRAMRRSMAAARKKLETAGREVATARRNWAELLARLGFPENLSVDEALAAWQRLVGAAERLAASKQARHELATINAIWEDYRRRIEDLACRLP